MRRNFIVGFRRGENAALYATSQPKQFSTSDMAVQAAKGLEGSHAGVVAWSETLSHTGAGKVVAIEYSAGQVGHFGV